MGRVLLRSWPKFCNSRLRVIWANAFLPARSPHRVATLWCSTTSTSAMPVLRASGYLLRPLEESDASSFAAAVRESMSTVGAWMPWASPDYTEDDALAWFAACDKSRASRSGHEFGIFGPDGTSLLGGAGLNQFNTANDFCNLGYWVRESAQRKGAALAAIRALSQFAFSELRQSRLEIVVAQGNLPSLALASKANFTHECLARNRIKLRGRSIAAHVFSLIPEAEARPLGQAEL